MKKRYYLTLTAETVEEFQAFCKEQGLPAVTLSNVADESIFKTLQVMKHIASTGKFSTIDMLELMVENLKESSVTP